MKIFKPIQSLLALVLLIISSGFAQAQMIEPVKWTYEIKQQQDNQIDIIITAKIDSGWELYSQEVPPGGPLPTEIKFTKNPTFQLVGKAIASPKAKESYDETFEMNIGKWRGQVKFTQKLKILKPEKFNVNIDFDYMVCNESSCIPLSDNLNFELDGKKYFTELVADDSKVIETSTIDTTEAISSNDEVIAEAKPIVEAEITETEEEKSSSVWYVFWLGLAGGLLALMTPCVWPIIPMTVSFFLNKTQTKSKVIRDAGFYGLSIVVVYVLLGLGISLIFGAGALQALATNPIFNLFFFGLLIVFALAFFGAFELTLPSSWVNAMDRKSEKSSGLVGVFFMALTLVLVSFSCTGPIVGALLVEAASSANFISPMLGMLGFSLAIAIPFTLLAIFPSWLKSMPKSGGWMNSVKVVLAFLMLAFALKFFVTADSVAGWNLMPREAFLAIWIVIFVMMGFYLLGKIKMYHDSDVKHLGVGRVLLAITSFSFALVLVPGMWGAPLKFISGFTPSITTQSFDLTKNTANFQINNDMSELSNYKIKEGSYGIIKFLDYYEGVEYAAKKNKPIFLDFSGIGCTNCKKMEASVWGEPEVLQMLMNDYVVISLYTDDRTSLPDDEQYVSTFGGKERRIRNIGQKWGDLQATKYNVNAQPYYVLLDNEEQMLNKPSGAEFNATKFSDFLKEGLNKYNSIQE